VTYEIRGARRRGRTKKTWKEVVESDLTCLHLCTSDHKNGENNLIVTMKVETVGDVYF